MSAKPPVFWQKSTRRIHLFGHTNDWKKRWLVNESCFRFRIEERGGDNFLIRWAEGRRRWREEEESDDQTVVDSRIVWIARERNVLSWRMAKYPVLVPLFFNGFWSKPTCAHELRFLQLNLRSASSFQLETEKAGSIHPRLFPSL